VRYRTSGPAVVSDTVDNETIIVDLDSGSYYELNHVGAAIWTQLLAGLAAGEIADDLRARFGADPETAQRDLDALIGRLVDERLIVAADGAPAANGASPADVVDRGLAYEAPMFRKHTDMQELLLLDPVYEVDETGWPSRP
jgi:Coenzyme PQQ synthesis protein D (PqqD)